MAVPQRRETAELEPCGHSPEWHVLGEAVLSMLRSGGYVLFPITLVVMTGDELAARLREMGKTLTVRLTDGSTRTVRSAGCYLTKAGLHVIDGHGVEVITDYAEIVAGPQ